MHIRHCLTLSSAESVMSFDYLKHDAYSKSMSNAFKKLPFKIGVIVKFYTKKKNLKGKCFNYITVPL